MDWSAILRIAHILGTSLGVGGTTLLGIYSIKYLKDSKNEPLQHEVVKICISAIRYGLILLTLSGLGLLILWRQKMLGPDVFFSDRFLAKMAIILILLSAAFMMNFKLINQKVGNAISTTAWYMAMVLGVWRSIPLSFFSIMLSFIGLVILVYFTLEFLTQKVTKM